MGATVLHVGDSITAGTGASVYANCYVMQTKAGLLTDGHLYYVVNSGISGRRSDELIQGFKNKGGKCDADIITIMCGTNDITQNVSVSTYQTNLGLLVDEVRKYMVTGQGQIVLLTIPWRNDSYTASVPNYNAAVQAVGTAKNVPVCDIYPAFNSSADMFDTLHPNDSGHQKIANILVPFLNNLSVWNNTRTR